MLKPRKQRDRPDDRGELQGAAVEPERRRAGDQVVIVVQQESRIDSDPVVVEEADHQEQRRRQREEHQQDQRQRRDLQPRHDPAADLIDGIVGQLRHASDGPATSWSCTMRVHDRLVREPGRHRGCLSCRARCSGHHAALFTTSRHRISGRIRVPNCSMPMTKSSNVSMTPRTPGTAASSSSMRATVA